MLRLKEYYWKKSLKIEIMKKNKILIHWMSKYCKDVNFPQTYLLIK